MPHCIPASRLPYFTTTHGPGLGYRPLSSNVAIHYYSRISSPYVQPLQRYADPRRPRNPSPELRIELPLSLVLRLRRCDNWVCFIKAVPLSSVASSKLLTSHRRLSLRKRFRASSRHAKGKGLVISVQTIAGHTLFACTVGDLGHPSGIGDVSMDSWQVVEGMTNVVRRTGHSSYYVEMGMGAMGKTAKQMHLQGEMRINGGGQFFFTLLFVK